MKTPYSRCCSTGKKYIIIDFANKVRAKYFPSHFPYGYKPAYQIAITQDQLKDLNFNKIAQNITTLL